MKTNNHPAHGPVSLERLHQIREILSKASAQSDGSNLGYAMADAVKVIDGAIAAFGAEPVGTFKNGPCGYYSSFHEDAVPLYTAPPAPVSVPDDEQCKPHPVMAVKGELGFIDRLGKIIEERDEDIDIGQLGCSNYDALMLAALDAFRASLPAPVVPTFDEWLEIRGNKPLGWVKDAMRESYDSCRAAMLQAGNSPVIGIDLASEPDRSVEVRYLAPPCYVMVPKEPTNEMLNAWLSEIANWRGHVAGYKAMLAAAPLQAEEPAQKK